MSDTPSQQQLGAFSTNTDEGSKSPSASAQPTGASTKTNQTTPLDELYEMVADAAASQLPDSAHTLSLSNPLEPPTKHHTTSNLPDSIPALPFEIGQWELAVTSPDRIIYATSGDAYDTRWGGGGGLYALEMYLNDSGANRDGNFHRQAQTLVGFENGDQIRQTDVSSRDDLISVRGFSPGNNSGDFGVSTGTQTRAETGKNAVLELILHLHAHPGSLGQVVNREPDTDWSLQKLSPRSAKWTATAPVTLDDNRLSLTVTSNTVRIKSNGENAPAHKTTYYNLPAIESVPKNLLAESSRRHTFETPAAAITATNELLSKSPRDAISAGRIK